MFRTSACHRQYSFLITLVSFLFTSQVAFSQYASPLLSEGGIESHVYKTDTSLFEAVVLEDMDNSLHRGSVTTGFSMLHSPYLSMFYIPLKYDFTDNFQISFSLPYLVNTHVYNDNQYTKNGYGDTLLGLTAYFDLSEILSSKTTVRFTFPTGNVNAVDFYYYIPLGYGGYTSSLQESISFNTFDAGPVSIRVFFSGLGVYYFSSTQQIDMVEKNTFDKSFAWSIMGGCEIGLTENLSIEIKANYINIAERLYKNSAFPGQTFDANDSVKQLNILPFIKYMFFDDLSGQAGLIYPLKSTQDSDIATTYDARWKIVLGIEKRFGNNIDDHDRDNLNTSDKTVNDSINKTKVTRKRYYKKKRRK